MKIFFSLVIACIIVAHVTAFNLHNSRLYNRHSVRLNAADSDVVAVLEQRLQAKLKQNQVEVQVNVPSNNAKQSKAVNAVVKKEAAAPVKSATVVKQPTQPEKKPVVQQQTQVAQKVAPVTAPVIKEQQKVQVQKVEAITASQVVAPSSENKITSAEVFEGIGLGALPFVLLPLLLFNSAKGLIGKLTAKPPAKKVEVSAPSKKVQPYTKSLAEGAKEGYAELASGKSTPELDDTRRAYKIVGASFGVGLLAVAFSFLSNGAGNSEVAVAPKVESKVVQVAPKKAEAPKVKVAAPAPVAKVDAKKAEQQPAANAEQKKTVEKKEELKEVEKKEAIATKTEEVKPAPVAPTVTQTAPKAEKVEVKSAPEPAPAAAPVVEKVEKKVEEKVAAAVQAPAPAPEKKVESAPVQAPEPVKKAEVAKPVPAPAPAVAQKPAATVKATTTPAVESSEVKTPQVVNVGDSKRVVQQAQPDVVDLSKFQSLRNKK